MNEKSDLRQFHLLTTAGIILYDIQLINNTHRFICTIMYNNENLNHTFLLTCEQIELACMV